jgi:sporulation protein YlmC with PRC-barrel domain
MLYNKMMISTAVALLACTACDQPMNQSAEREPQSQNQAVNEPTPVPVPVDQSTTTDTAADMQATAIPLSDVQNPEQTLVAKQVKDSKGEAIGEVKSVALNADGTVQMVTVNTGSSTVALNASDLKFAQADNTIISDKSKAEIDKGPTE